MIANLYGADVTQDEIVARTYGPGVNRPGSFEVITATLNGSGTTHSGRTYRIESTMLGNSALPVVLVTELTAGHPVMLGYDANGSGHAVVCTAVTYDGPDSNPIITALTVRDPWPSSDGRSHSGRRVVSGADLGPHILEGWVIHLTVHDNRWRDHPRAAGLRLQRPGHADDPEHRPQHPADGDLFEPPPARAVRPG